MVSGCERFYKVESGNDCFDIAQEANVNLTSFYAWNVSTRLDISNYSLFLSRWIEADRTGKYSQQSRQIAVDFRPANTYALEQRAQL